MSYARNPLGLTLDYGAILGAPAPIDPNAWRVLWRDKMIALANLASAISRTLSNATQRSALETMARAYLGYAVQAAGTTPKANLQFAIGFSKLPAAVDEPSGLTSTQASALRNAIAPLRTQLNELKALVNPPAVPPPPPANIQIFTGGVKVPLLTGKTGSSGGASPPPPPVSESRPEVECTDGYVRDATGLCMPGAAPPGAQLPPDVTPMTIHPSGYAAPPADWAAVSSWRRQLAELFAFTERSGSEVWALGVGTPDAAFSNSLRIWLRDMSFGTVPDAAVVSKLADLAQQWASVRNTAPPGIQASMDAAFATAAALVPGSTTSATLTSAPGAGPLGVSLKWWAVGAIGVAVAGGVLLMSKKKVTPNRRRRHSRHIRRNTGFLTSGARVKKRGALGRASGSIVEVHGEKASVRWDSGGRPEWVNRSAISRA